MLLETLLRRFLIETQTLLTGFAAPLPAGPMDCPPVHRASREMGVLRLWDGWTRFCRELVIASAVSRPVTVAGLHLPKAPNVQRRRDVLPLLRLSFGRRQKPPWWEPHWGIATDAIDAAQRLQVANFASISGGLGALGSPAEDLRRVRNFLAHRGEDTYSYVEALSARLRLPHESRPDQLIQYMVPPGVPVFEFWVVQLRVVAQAACT